MNATDLTTEQEFATVIEQLTTEELVELDQRIAAGEIEGRRYLDFDHERPCGCFYGTITLIRYTSKGIKDSETVVQMKADLVGEEYASHYAFTPIEDQLLAESVMWGDTPETSSVLEWLHHSLTAEIARRTS